MANNLAQVNPNLADESKEMGKNILRYAITFELKRSRDLDGKIFLEQLVHVINLQSFEENLVTQNTLILSQCMNAMHYDVHDET